MFRFFGDLVEHVSDVIRPPERMTVAEAAARYRKLNNPGSYVGDWNNDFAPYLVEIMETLTSLEYTGMAIAGPARCGKSDMFFNWLLHSLKCEPADIIAYHMTKDTARDWSIVDLQRFFRHSELDEYLLEGSRNNNVHDIKFRNGSFLRVKWPVIAEMSGKTTRYVWEFDYDRFPQNVDGEGSPFDLGRKRTGTMKRFGMTVAESSPGFSITNGKWRPPHPNSHEAPPTEGILSIYNRGDRRRRYWRCPKCKGVFEPKFDLMRWPKSADLMDAAESCWMQCPACEHRLYHEGRHGDPGKLELDAAGRWVPEGCVWAGTELVGERIRTDIASWWILGTMAAFTTWKDLVYKELVAQQDYDRTGSEEALKTTRNTDQGVPYLPKALESQNTLTPEDLKGRAQEIGERVVPLGVRFLVASIDVQGNRFEVQIHGVGTMGDIWIVDRFKISKSKRLDDDNDPYPVRPGVYLEDWYLIIEQVMNKTYPLGDDSGRHMAIKLTVCDSGGRAGVTSNAYAFWHFLRYGPDPEDPKPDDALWSPGLRNKFELLKGSSNRDAPRVQMRYPDSEKQDKNAAMRGEVPIFFINPNLMKDRVDNMLSRETPGGGMVTFPKWLDNWFYSELLAETRTPKGWENLAKHRNEAWDLLVYAVSATLHPQIRIESIQWGSPPTWADVWEKNDLVFDPIEIEAPFKPRKMDQVDLMKLGEQLA